VVLVVAEKLQPLNSHQHRRNHAVGARAVVDDDGAAVIASICE
jgi:hypothetical protein